MAEENRLHARTLAQGATWGTADEAEAWARDMLGMLPPGVTREMERKRIMQDVERFREAHPYSAASQEFGAGVAPGMIAGLLTGGPPGAIAGTLGPLARVRALLTTVPSRSAVTQGAKYGAVSGALGGAGAAEPGTRIEGAMAGAVGGGVFGGAVPVLANLGKRAISGVRDAIIPATERSITARAARKLNEQMQGQGVTSADLERLSRENYNTYGVPTSLASELPTAAMVLSRRHAGLVPEATALQQQLRRTQEGAGSRVMEQFRQRLNPKSWMDTEDTITTNLRTNAKPMYEQAYAYGQVDDPRILEALRANPMFKKAFGEASKIAQQEAHAAKLRGEDPTPYMLQNIYKPVQSKVKKVDPITGVETEVDQPGVFDLELTTMPDLRTLDYVKRGLDSIIESGYKSGKSSARTRAMRDSRNAFVNVLDELSPEYKAARAQYAGDAEVLDALREGNANFAKMKHEDVKKLFGTMSAAEKDAFRVGAIRQLEDRIMKGRGNPAAMLSQDKMMQRRIDALFDDPNKASLFKAALEREAQMYHKASRALGGSDTEPLRVAGKQIETEPGIMGADAPDLVGGGLMQKALQFVTGEQQVPPEVLGRLATMLQAGNPNEVGAVVKILENQRFKDLVVGKASRAAQLGVTTSTAGATAVPDMSSEVSAGDLILNEMIDYYNSLKESGEGR